MKELQHSIVTKALELFMRYGFKSVTVDDIAQVAGISKKTLYENFKDKDEIVYSALDVMDKDIHQKEEAIMKKSTNAVEEVIGIMAMLEGMFKNMNPNCMKDLQKYYPSAFKEWECHTDLHEQLIRKNLKRGIKEGYYRKNIEIDILSFLRVEGIMIGIKNPKATEYDFTKLQLAQTEIFLYGISTLEGHALIEKHLTQLRKKK